MPHPAGREAAPSAPQIMCAPVTMLAMESSCCVISASVGCMDCMSSVAAACGELACCLLPIRPVVTAVAKRGVSMSTLKLVSSVGDHQPTMLRHMSVLLAALDGRAWPDRAALVYNATANIRYPTGTAALPTASAKRSPWRHGA